MVRFGCKKCGYPNVREMDHKLYCMACGSVFSTDIETKEERDARILYLDRFERAESLLRLSPPKFDDAEDYYRDFINHYPENSEGYWGIVRARYGIKYEIDTTGKQVPTCYKSSYQDFRQDADFRRAVQFAESEAVRKKYNAEADAIAKICNEWQKEAKKFNYDVFISFKGSESGTNAPTEDLMEMKQLYAFLKEEGYNVFFSPITLRRYSSENYEPYIFGALQSAKVILVYGSNPEYFTSTWVESEWTRFLRMIDRGEKKRGSCIVACNGFNPKELPHLLRNLQAIDASSKNRNFYNEVLNNIKKVLSDKDDSRETVIKQEEITDIIRQYEEEKNRQNIQKVVKRKTENLQSGFSKLRELGDDLVIKFTEYKIDKRKKRNYPPVIFLIITVALLLLLLDLRLLCFVGLLAAFVMLIVTCKIAFGSKFESVRINNNKLARIVCLITLVIFCFGCFRMFFQVGIIDNVIIGNVLVSTYDNGETVEIPEGVSVISSYAFAGKAGLRGQKIKTIKLPAGVDEIQFGAFANCRNLEEIYLSGGGVSTNAAAFLNCKNLKRVYFYGDLQGVNRLANSGFFSTGGTRLRTIEIYCYNYRTESFPSRPSMTMEIR